MRGARRVLSAIAAIAMTAGVTAATSGTAHASGGGAPASAAPNVVETDYQNPVVAEPPVSRPPTRACTTTLANNFPSNAADGSPQSFAGTLSPPAGCRGPWAKVVMDWTTSGAGRQFDRSASLTIGTTQVYFGTTAEPDPDGITYHFATDLTRYSALLKSPQPFTGGIGNYVDSTYVGVYYQTVRITYYTADRARPSPAEPDRVVGLGAQDVNATTPSADFAMSNLPRNITRAVLEISIKGNGCDEQWFDDVPDDVSAKYPAAGLCGHGPYREVQAGIDGTRAGVAQYFPFIYSGGIVPTLWRPIVALGTFDMTYEDLDVTPFAGRLVDGKAHTLSLTVANAGDTWNLAANLLLYTDHHAARTSGSLTRNTIAASAAVTTTERALAHDDTKVTVTANRNSVLAGYVNTSAGRITTTVAQHVAYRNVDTVSDGGLVQDVAQADTGRDTTTAAAVRAPSSATERTWSWPITIHIAVPIYVDGDNYKLAGNVDMSRIEGTVALRGQRWTNVTGGAERLRTQGVLQRTGGAVVQADGSATDLFVGLTDNGRPYAHYIAADHGYVTRNRVYRP